MFLQPLFGKLQFYFEVVTDFDLRNSEDYVLFINAIEYTKNTTPAVQPPA